MKSCNLLLMLAVLLGLNVYLSFALPSKTSAAVSKPSKTKSSSYANETSDYFGTSDDNSDDTSDDYPTGTAESYPTGTSDDYPDETSGSYPTGTSDDYPDETSGSYPTGTSESYTNGTSGSYSNGTSEIYSDGTSDGSSGEGSGPAIDNEDDLIEAFRDPDDAVKACVRGHTFAGDNVTAYTNTMVKLLLNTNLTDPIPVFNGTGFIIPNIDNGLANPKDGEKLNRSTWTQEFGNYQEPRVPRRNAVLFVEAMFASACIEMHRDNATEADVYPALSYFFQSGAAATSPMLYELGGDYDYLTYGDVAYSVALMRTWVAKWNKSKVPSCNGTLYNYGETEDAQELGSFEFLTTDS